MNRSQMIRASWGSWMSQSYHGAVGPAWWQYVWTFLFSMAVAAGFTVVGFAMFASGDGAWRNLSGWAQWYGNYLVVSLAIGYSIHGLFALGRQVFGVPRIRRFSRWQRTAYFALLPLAGVAIGLAIGTPLVDRSASTLRLPSDGNAVFGSVLLSLLVWLLFQNYFSARHRRLAAERRATEAQLRLLQAQMEPHFLFNTLANVVGLMEADTPRAKAMLESFTDYLRASLGSLRSGEHTLGDEMALVEAYLRVVGVRMEERLRIRIDVPAALRSLRVPALSLQPLVENAVVHGLEPSIEGGTLQITARREAGQLTLQVSDDGVGITASPQRTARGAGVALDNLRERLAQIGDPRAGLHIVAAPPRGVSATLTLPAITEGTLA
jgi:signal transduction histidine kinase